MNYIVTAAQVRDYLELNSPGSTSRYSDQTIGSNIMTAQEYLEHITHRWFAQRDGVTWAVTTMLQAQVALPGFRTITSCTWGGSSLSVAVPGDGNTSPSAWGLLEPHQVPAPLITGLQFRPWRADNDGGAPWYYADRYWWDKALDSPFYPGNRGGGYAWTSMPNDLVVVGDGGYLAGAEPYLVRHVVKVLASWYTMRPASILADSALTPAGGVLEYTSLPPEVRDFIADWGQGTQVQSVG